MSTSPIKSIVKNATEMKLIESKAIYLPQDEGLEGVYRQIEIAGRTCYKSEDKITKDSAEKFFDRMYRSNHTAMLEHGTVYLKRKTEYAKGDYNILEYKYSYNPYSKVCYDGANIYITTNMRVIVENLWLADLQYVCEPTDYHEKRYTMKFITDRGVSHKQFVA